MSNSAAPLLIVVLLAVRALPVSPAAAPART